jgi:beta-glucosidase
VTAPAVLTIVVSGLAVTAAVAVPASGLLSSPAAPSRPRVPGVTGDARADALLARMSLADKLTMLEWIPDLTLGPGKAATLPGLPRLGIPSLRLATGMPGVATRRTAPAMTAPLGVAATFSERDAQANGTVIGRDARALGEQVVGLPLASVATGPPASGDVTTFGGDPLLTGRLAAAEVRGIQRQGTMAMAGDYAAGDAAATSLHEVYLPPFQAAVRAGLAAVMCAPAPGQAGGATPAGLTVPASGPGGCADPGMMLQVLRGELGFGGFVSSGWGANPSTLSLNSGLDLDIPAGAGAPPPAGGGAPDAGATGGGATATGGARPVGGYFAAAAVRAAVANGSLRLATIDRAVGAVLAEMDRFGLLRHGLRAGGQVPVAADERVVQRTSQDAATLLKNDDHALPLTGRDLSSVALIGAGAGQDVVGGTTGPGGWDASGYGPSQASPYQALRRDLGNRPGSHLSYSPGDDLTGVPVPASLLSHDGQPGLLRTATQMAPAQPAVSSQQRDSGQPAEAAVGGSTAGSSVGQAGDVPADGAQQPLADQFTRPARTVPELDNTTADGAALPAGSAHDWSGELTVPQTGTYRLGLALSGAEGAITLDSHTITSSGTGAVLIPRHGITGPATDSIIPTSDGLDNLSARVRLTAGTHTLNVAEVPDASGRPVQVRLEWVTPADQQARRAAAISAASHARTAVVFAWSTGTGGAPLPDHQDQLIKAVAAVNPDTIVVLQTPGPVALPWFRAVKAVVQMWYPGDPGGAASASVLLGRVNPAGRLPFAWPAKSHSGKRGNVIFPLGYGLSYTEFGYSGLSVSVPRGGGLTVRFRVTNTGRAAGQEVPQVYLGPPPRRASGGPGGRALAAFTRIALRPGQSREVTLRVPGRQLQFWDDTRGWVTAAGQRLVYVGPSAGVSALTGIANVPG